MRAGKLDRTIIVQRRQPAGLDDYGVPLKETTGSPLPDGSVPHWDVWVQVAELRAQLVQASSEEFIRASGAQTETEIVFRTRYLAGLTVADRIVFDGRTHDVKELKEIGRRRGLEIRTIARGLS